MHISIQTLPHIAASSYIQTTCSHRKLGSLQQYFISSQVNTSLWLTRGRHHDQDSLHVFLKDIEDATNNLQITQTTMTQRKKSVEIKVSNMGIK